MNNVVPMIVDVDTGLDDALALAYVVRSPRVALRAVTCVSGNVELAQVYKNTCAVLENTGAAFENISAAFENTSAALESAAADPALIVTAGAERPLLNEPHHAQGFHGTDGLGGLRLEPSQQYPDGLHAVEAMRYTVEAEPGQITLLALGPLTNVALFIRMWPGVASLLKRIVFMGGAVNGGNATAVAEFNAWHDPEALDIVLRSGIRTEMFSLDVFSQTLLGEDVVARLAASAGVGAFVHRLLRAQGVDDSRIGLGDAGAAIIAARPDLCTVKVLPTYVQLDGAARGQTIVDMRAEGGESEAHGLTSRAVPCTVVTAIDAPGIAAEFADAVLT